MENTLVTSDHDMLVRLDENIKNLIIEFQNFKARDVILDSRVRILEDNITRLSPIPSVSHEVVVKDIAFLTSKIDLLEKNKAYLQGGWKVILAISAIVSFLVYTLANTVNFAIK